MERAELKRWVLGLPGAVEAGGFVFLTDPAWGTLEREQARTAIDAASAMDTSECGWLCIPTGGTSGVLKYVRHDHLTLTSAVLGFVRHFAMPVVNTINVLPSHHVSGLMSQLRAHLTGGACVNTDWKQLTAGNWPKLESQRGAWCLSLVPTQLQRLMDLSGGREFLKCFQIVFVGGAAIWPQLADAAAEAGLPISLTYGMTETAAMVTAQQPVDFLRGARDTGRPLPHVTIELLHEISGSGDGSGRVSVSGGSVFRGYFPETRTDQVFQTEDIARFLPSGALHVLGRTDAVINSGGKKVWPGEVENVLRSTGAFADVAVIGVADETWGERVVACHSGGLTAAGLEKAQAALQCLAKYKHPKQFLAVTPWPRNAQGKINRAALRAAAGQS